MRTLIPFVKLSIVAAAAAPVAGQAALHDFTLFMDQAGEIAASSDPVVAGKRPLVPGPSAAFGGGVFRYDDVSNLFTLMSMSGTGLLGTITAQHIHVGAAGVSGPVALGLPAPIFFSGGSFAYFASPVGPFPEMHEAALLSGMTYVNIHTTFDGVGEIRGQLTPVVVVPEPGSWALMLGGLGLMGFVGGRRLRRR